MTDDQRKWHTAQCERYREEYPTYKDYAALMERILRAACSAHAPTAIVQARPKRFSSFAEKMARKAERYSSLNIGPTDLCGARVITDTSEETEKICALIRDNFRVDEENSLDARSRLSPDEFGYLSFHYVVQLKGIELFGVDVPPETAMRIGLLERASVGRGKCEIQVRTLLQHAYASIAHDRLYKTSLLVRDSLKREMARTAALLEEGDAAFGNCVRALSSYRVHYGTYMSRERLKEETEILQGVLNNEPEEAQKPGIALRLAQLAQAEGNYHRVLELLEPYADPVDKARPDVLAEHGHALCRDHLNAPESTDFQRGLEEIDLALETASERLKVRVLGYRAWALSRIPHAEKKTRDAYAAALDADPSNPFHLASFLECEIFLGEKLGLRSALSPSMTLAIRKCRDHIEAGIEVPWSFIAIGRLELLLDHPFESLAAYAKVIQLCLEKDSAVPPSALENEIVFMQRINRGRDMPEHHAWVYTLLLLGRLVWTGQPSADLSASRRSFTKPVVILAGGSAAAAQEAVDRCQATVLKAFKSFKGTIISGGTESGVPGLAGEIAAAQGAQQGGLLQVLGYIPRQIPWDQPVDRRYTEHVPSDGRSYGAGHTLLYWTDLILAGVEPKEVRLLGIDGGKIAAFEYRLALALGAHVAIMEPATRAAKETLQDPDWARNTRLISVLDDARSIQAFTWPPQPRLTSKQLEVAAEKIHEAYLSEKHYVNPDAAMQPWKKLRDEFKDSNRMQAAAAAGFLERVGFTVSEAAGPIDPLKLTTDEIETLAEMEHGRWNVERLQRGWRYSEKRDTDKKLHPDLIGWDRLPGDIKKWDRDAVSKWPKLLADAGFRVARGLPAVNES
jgi:ppGpp synthetase/RelA/SpoT-type nucleotidyltranferase